MLLRLVFAELRHRPGRALFLLGGYALGVAVMVVLLAVGQAMLTQARDRALVGGGDVVLVPAGISPELLKAGGATSLFLGINQARFIQRDILESPRARRDFGVVAASPVLEGKLVEVGARGRIFRAVAAGSVPSRARAVGAAPQLLAGRWDDSDADRRWVSPTPGELYDEIDRFHLPTGAAAHDSTWAEWHYFNTVLDDDRWIYLTFLVGGRMAVPGEWGGRVLLTIRERDGTHRSLTRDIPGDRVRFDTASATLALGPENSVTQEDGVYHVRATLSGAEVRLDIVPAPYRYFPPTDLGGTALVSGYVAPALYAEAAGEVCLPRCKRVRRAQAYHDHNWGVWRNVAWEWGTASDATLSLLYGAVRGDSTLDQGIFAYLVDSEGVRGVFRPRALEVSAWQTVSVEGAPLKVPREMHFEDLRRGVGVTIAVTAVHVTDTGRPRHRYFVQMSGTARVEEAGQPTTPLSGFFETYVDRDADVMR